MLYNEPKKNWWSKIKKTKVFLYTIIILIITLTLFTSQIIFSSESITHIANNFFTNFFDTENKTLQGETNNRINFLLLGIGGKDHDGANLTDSIILVSLQIKPLKAAMISIPRDLLVFVNGYGYRKINSIHALQENKEEDSGPETLAQTVAQTFNMPIHYYLRVDFDGVKKLIDDLDGLDVYVENSFTDYLYPAPNYKYQTISFDKGWTTMDGETLLQYMRSRHGNNGESGDFARAKRQQNAITAAKEKLLSAKTWLNPKNVYNLLDSYSEHLYTNLETWEILKLANLTQNLSNENIIKFGLNDNYDNYLQASNYQGSYVLLPKAGDFSEIQTVLKNIFNKKVTEQAWVEVLNGTEIYGLASKTSDKLENEDINVSHIGNAPQQDYTQSYIYDLSNGAKPVTLESLKEFFPQANIDTDLPFGIDTTADFVVILATDYASSLENSNNDNDN